MEWYDTTSNESHWIKFQGTVQDIIPMLLLSLLRIRANNVFDTLWTRQSGRSTSNVQSPGVRGKRKESLKDYFLPGNVFREGSCFYPALDRPNGILKCRGAEILENAQMSSALTNVRLSDDSRTIYHLCRLRLSIWFAGMMYLKCPLS